ESTFGYGRFFWAGFVAAWRAGGSNGFLRFRVRTKWRIDRSMAWSPECRTIGCRVKVVALTSCLQPGDYTTMRLKCFNGLPLKSKESRRNGFDFMMAMHRAEATVLTETSLSISARLDQFGPTTHRFHLRGCKHWQSHAAAAVGRPVRCASHCGNELRSAARRSARLIVRKFLPKGPILRRQSGQFHIRTVPARRLIRMVLLNPSSALVRVGTSRVSFPRRSLRKTVRNQWA